VTWRHIIGAGLLAGIGFTMALFIAALAFGDSEQLAEAKMSVLAASLIAGIAGWLVLTVGVRATDQDASSSTEPHGIAS
jgi:NhaA family Na+:H+ antiporter